MRTGFLLHPHHQPPPPSSVVVTWYVGSWWWVCPIACEFIHNYSRYLEPKLNHADGPGWTGVHRQVSCISVRVSPDLSRVQAMPPATTLLRKMRDGRHSSTSGSRWIRIAVRGSRGPQQEASLPAAHEVFSPDLFSAGCQRTTRECGTAPDGVFSPERGR